MDIRNLRKQEKLQLYFDGKAYPRTRIFGVFFQLAYIFYLIHIGELFSIKLFIPFLGLSGEGFRILAHPSINQSWKSIKSAGKFSFCPKGSLQEKREKFKIAKLRFLSVVVSDEKGHEFKIPKRFFLNPDLAFWIEAQPDEKQFQKNLVYINQSKILLVIGLVLLAIDFSYLKFFEKVSPWVYLSFNLAVALLTLLGGALIRQLIDLLLRRSYQSRSFLKILLFLRFKGRFPSAFLFSLIVSYFSFISLGLLSSN